MTAASPFPVTVRWYTPEEGGRSRPPNGPQYAATGRFSSQSPDEMFSVVLTLQDSATGAGRFPAALHPLFPERVPGFADRLARGEKLILHEGRTAVAECVAAPGE